MVDLAHCPPCRLGDLVVHPALRTVARGELSVTLEPRVMQVLVALARADGAILSRDDLIMTCWGGRVVGDNAIARVISQLRRLGPGLGTEDLRIDTISKVGYRLIADERCEPVAESDAALPPQRAGGNGDPEKPGRRLVLFGAGAAVLGLGGAGLWLWRSVPRQPRPEALALYQRAIAAQRQWDYAQDRQAVSLLEQAVAIDPLFADAWGALALGYYDLFDLGGNSSRQGLPQQCVAAARRALELDSGNADAQLALIVIRTPFRNWLWMENALSRLVQRFPDHQRTQGELGNLRYEQGRWRAGLVQNNRALEIDPYIVSSHFARARALWAIGRIREAERALDLAIERWSGQAPIWILKFNLLLFSGRPGEAGAFAANPLTRPENMRQNGIDARIVLARAVEQGHRADVDATIADLRALEAGAIDIAPITAPLYLLLGHRDEAVRGLERYYFGDAEAAGASAVPTRRAFDQRSTTFLFLPSLRPLWRDPAFASLLARIGLEDYWARSRTQPDFRNAA